ncbi:MAG TPA: tetratricopeptide repeat protein [Vicinamibacterales bacterium]|nr:tetratricopeptide repeat protein [Vicinamibacterales bacterium]
MAKRKAGGRSAGPGQNTDRRARSGGLTTSAGAAGVKTARGCAVVLILLAIAAYSNSFSGVLIGDDDAGIANNQSIRSLSTALAPPADTTVAGRPVANLTFAINYAIAGGTSDLSSYHFINLAIHVLAGLLLFGVARRTLTSPALNDRFGGASAPLALVIAAIWIVHPLNTQAVTFLVQRVESLMGLFYLATLYCAIRAAESDLGDRKWIAAAIAACALGMATKETMVGAPILATLWLWICWPGKLSASGFLQLAGGLAGTWVIVLALAFTDARPQSAGFDVAGWTPLLYLRTQAEVIVHYLRLVFWPVPLVFQYAWLPPASWAMVWPQAALLVVLGLATLIALIRRLPVGLIGAAFFLILGPSSSLLPVATEVAAEHRMYLPLAAVIAVVVLAAFRIARRFSISVTVSRAAGWVAAGVAVVLLIGATHARNRVYASPEAMALDVVTSRPQNAQAQLTYGVVLMNQKQFAAAESHLRAASTLPLSPSTNEAMSRAVAHLYLGLALSSQQKFEEAAAELQQAIALRPDSLRAYAPLAEAQLSLKRPRDAVATLETALTQRAGDVVLLKRAAWVMATSSDAGARNGARAVELAERAVAQTNGRDAIALDVLAAAYAEAGQFDRALDAVRRGLALAPPGDTSGPSQMMRSHVEMFQTRQPIRTREW